MASVLITKTIVGSVGRVYDLREVGKNGNKALDFSVAVTPRKKEGDEWVDGETIWQNITVWNRLAENVASSLRSGDRVVVIGRESQKPEYTNKDGVVVPARPIVVADYVGLELTYHGAQSKREARGGNSGDGNSYNNARSSAPAAAPAAKPAQKDTDIFADDDFDFDSGDVLPF